jgi:hypothetical protein
MRPLAPILAVAVLLVTSGTARAARPIRGRVRGAGGYLIVGTSAAGEGVTQPLGADGTFALRFPGSSARGATLHLIGPGGRYFGPVVLRRRRRSGFLALSGKPGNLGEIVLHASRSHAPRRR